MKTVLITGVAGFLGSHVAARCIANGWRVVGIDDLSGGRRENVPEGVIFYLMDVCDESAVARLFEHTKFQAIIHCAAFASENLSHNCRLHTYRSIVIGSAVLTNAAVNHNVDVFVSMSSIAVYGHRQPPFHEEQIPTPMDCYGAAKTCMEHDLKAANDFFGMQYVIFRPHNIIGVRQNRADSTRNVASIFIRQALEGRPLTVFGSGDQTRAFSPVSYVAAVIAASIDRPETWNNTYNVGGDTPMTVIDLACMVMDLCESWSIYHLPERNEAKHAYSKHERVAWGFPDFDPEAETIRHCLAAMVDEARSAPVLPIQALPRIEIASKLNPAWK